MKLTQKETSILNLLTQYADIWCPKDTIYSYIGNKTNSSTFGVKKVIHKLHKKGILTSFELGNKIMFSIDNTHNP
jgi:predicted transcriptional regulator